MIKQIGTKSFKSIRTLSFECNRINVFIGPPNSGKSNILEALAYLSYFLRPQDKRGWGLEDFIRFDHRTDLFYDFEVINPIKISFDEYYINDANRRHIIFEIQPYFEGWILDACE